ncbi:hypothetical protein NPIL_332571 [Nephila pilipes]|uniref:DUF5641 domain-containing protein n=1 Tax=Nephila pilipes TaxID=299642 RepID=A0A8X6QRW4_NEPPI|nr:hypothetical protein NPIL_332571 [Nephila pilipes]
MKTRLTFREDTQDFKFLLILPSDHPVVTRKITETFPGKDGIVRLAKVRTARGKFLRPIQRLYLEINVVSVDSLCHKAYRETGTSAQAKKMDQTSRMTQAIQTTRLGRKVKAVQRLNP